MLPADYSLHYCANQRRCMKSENKVNFMIYIYIYIYIYIATHHEASNRKVKGDSYHESKTPVRVTHMQLAAIHSS